MRILFILISIMLLTACDNQSLATVVDKYDVSKLSVDFGNNEAYEIGANSEGMPIFKDAKAALKQAKSDYVEGFKAVAEEFELEPISHDNFQEYKTYGWQITVMDKNIQQQGVDITKFLDIYENSFE
ncbi:hypothetical protein [Fredinandcohnia quinoae]|uniref:Uncharacterized protein n=1 Tax=Fredinandcohnia quinoae TaxID=2918902 RepID=A0AAW5E598_9BACI|nr:hypothetical protein [Fredinandcohnia sp. SECRCQ15]MCH1624536.1 hypothetical protein [Fredinandcohnia sp. SECRCQ15]